MFHVSLALTVLLKSHQTDKQSKTACQQLRNIAYFQYLGNSTRIFIIEIMIIKIITLIKRQININRIQNELQ